MKRLLALTCLLVLATGSPLWAQRAGTIGQDGEWNLRHVGSATHVTLGFSPSLSTYVVSACGPTLATAIASRPGRRDLRLQNVGTVNIYVGGAHAALTASNGYTLHAASVSPGTSRLDLDNFQGRIDCITDAGPTQGQTLNILEILR